MFCLLYQVETSMFKFFIISGNFERFRDLSKKGGPKEGWTVPGCSLSLFLIQLSSKTIWKREIDVDLNTGLPCTETPIEEEKNLSPSLFSVTYVVTFKVAGKVGLTIGQ